MREIKFRAHNTQTKKIMPWEKIKKLRNLQKLMTLEHVVLMQYTGLKDKNGKEIYEGDVVKSFLFNRVCTIVYEYNAFVVKDLYGSYTRDSHYVRGNTVEVIGNIYENPELLEQKQ